MSSVKKRRLCIIALVLAICVSLGAVLMIRASAPVETKTVYLLPKPNPERAEILARALQPRRQAYATRASDEAKARDTLEESSESSSSESLSHDAEFDDAEFESYLLGLEDETAEEKRDFPLVPAGFPSHLIPVWKRFPGYQKGDMPDHELIYRVLIKLWNEGERGFIAATITSEGRVHPHYPNTIYVRWKEKIDENGVKKRYINRAGSSGDVRLTDEQMLNGEIPPGIRVLDYDSGGYDAYEFLS